MQLEGTERETVRERRNENSKEREGTLAVPLPRLSERVRGCGACQRHAPARRERKDAHGALEKNLRYGGGGRTKVRGGCGSTEGGRKLGRCGGDAVAGRRPSSILRHHTHTHTHFSPPLLIPHFCFTLAHSHSCPNTRSLTCPRRCFRLTQQPEQRRPPQPKQPARYACTRGSCWSTTPGG